MWLSSQNTFVKCDSLHKIRLNNVSGNKMRGFTEAGIG